MVSPESSYPRFPPQVGRPCQLANARTPLEDPGAGGLEKVAPNGEARSENCTVRCDLHCLFGYKPVIEQFSHLADLIATVKHRKFEPKQRIFSIGDQPGAIVSIRSGLLKLADCVANGVERIVLLAGRGNAVGLEALLNQPMQHDAVAIRPTGICWVPLHLLQELSLRDANLHRCLMAFWQVNLDFAAQSLARFSVGPLSARIARLIAFRAAIEKSRNPGEITLLGRQDMAAILGVAPENVSRAIADFKRAKLLRKIKRDVYQCDLARICALAENGQPGGPLARRSRK
jgi:CRP-like cAMP-binding protein